MTVGTLIEILKEYDKDKEIYITFPNYCIIHNVDYVESRQLGNNNDYVKIICEDPIDIDGLRFNREYYEDMQDWCSSYEKNDKDRWDLPTNN